MAARFQYFPVSNPDANLAPVLVVAATEAGMARAGKPIEDAGWRTAAVPIVGACDRIREQPNASAIWIEAEEDDDLDRLIGAAAAHPRFPALISCSLTMIDRVLAILGEGKAELLVDPSPVERISALSLVTASRNATTGVHDVSAEPSAVRLRQLSDEVGRIAATLARLSVTPGAMTSVELPDATGSDLDAPVSGEMVRAVIRARRLRARFFDADLFADPAWDMLLDLFQAEIAQHRVPVSSLCIAAAVPPTTALRWIKTMTDSGLFRRRADPHDGRRVFVELAPEASSAMRRYFSSVGAVVAA